MPCLSSMSCILPSRQPHSRMQLLLPLQDPLGLNNATLSQSAIFVPGTGLSQDSVREWLNTYIGDSEGLCAVQLNGLSICDGTVYTALPFSVDIVSESPMARHLLTLVPATPLRDDEDN